MNNKAYMPRIQRQADKERETASGKAENRTAVPRQTGTAAPHSGLSPMLQLQAQIGNRAVGQMVAQRLPAVTKAGSEQTGAVQRKLKTRTGTIFDADSVKPDDPAKVQAAKQHASFYLLQSNADVASIEAGQMDGIPILSPHKHLIGETHSASQFHQALSDWGWGAQHMVEKLSTHPRMRQPSGEAEVRNDPQAPEYQGLPLENTVAKQLAIINMASFAVRLLKDYSQKDTLTGQEENLVLNRVAPMLRNELGNLEEIKDALMAYKGNSPGFLAKKFGNAVDFPGLPEIEALKNIKEKSELLRRVDRRIDLAQTRDDVSYLFKDIDAMETVLNAMKDACLAIIKGEDNAAYDGADMDNKRNNFGDTPTGQTDDLREHYMAEHIANDLSAPGLVKIGSGHIAGISAKNIADVKPFGSYAAFKAATEADNAL